MHAALLKVANAAEWMLTLSLMRLAFLYPSLKADS